MSRSARVLSLGNLEHLDNGKPLMAINHNLKQAYADCTDRPGDKAKRTVTVTFDFYPNLNDDLAQLETVDVQIKTKVGVPVRKSKAYPMLPSDRGPMFEPLSPLDPTQPMLAGMAADEKIDRETGEVVTTGEDGDEVEM